jgi:hypothetical protein
VQYEQIASAQLMFEAFTSIKLAQSISIQRATRPDINYRLKKYLKIAKESLKDLGLEILV